MSHYRVNTFVKQTGATTNSEVGSYRSRIPGGFVVGPDATKDKYYHHLFKEPLFLGVELEVEPVGGSGKESYAAEKVADALNGFVMLKHDGSLGPGGFEIVTVPATLEAHRVIWKKFHDDSPNEYLRSWGTGRCGLHVHINRASLSDLAQGKLMQFMNNMDNYSFLSDIAGRDLKKNSYCRMSVKSAKWSHGKTIKKDKDGKIKIDNLFKPSDHSQRYQAVNVSATNNYKTMEFRIFRGNVGFNGFNRAIEFVHAVCEFVTETPATRLNYLDFINWFGQQGNYTRFPELYKWMVSKKYLFTKPMPSAGTTKVPKEKLEERTAFFSIPSTSNAA